MSRYWLIDILRLYTWSGLFSTQISIYRYILVFYKTNKLALPACSAAMLFLLSKETWFYNWELLLLFFSNMLSDSEIKSEVRSSISLCLFGIISISEFWQICINISNKSTGIIINKFSCLKYLFLYNIRFSKIDFISGISIALIILIIFLALETDSIFFFSLYNIYNKSLLNVIFLEIIICLS